MFLKLTGSVCVLVACVGFVREILRTGNLHRKMLESLIEMTELLAAEIRYERLPIQDALLQVQSATGDFYCAATYCRADEKGKWDRICDNLGAGVS